MTKFNPKDFQIHITSFLHTGTGKEMFRARVTELKNIYLEEITAEKAYKTALKEIKILKDHYDKQGLIFPLPFKV